MVSKIKQFDIVQVEWTDAAVARSSHISELETRTGTLSATTIGWFLKKDKKRIVVALTRFEDDTLNDILSIPTPWITKITKIK